MVFQIYDAKQLRDLYVSTWQGHIDKVKELLNTLPANYLFENQRTLLHVAAWFNQAEIVQYLLTKNVQLNALDSFGKTPLMLAIENNSIASFRLLAKKETLTFLNTKDLNSSIQNIPSTKENPYTFFKKKIINTTPMHLLVKLGNIDNLKWVKDKELITDFISIKDEFGNSLAHEAVKEEQWKILTWLYSNGLNQDIVNNDGIKVLDLLKQSPSGIRLIKNQPI